MPRHAETQEIRLFRYINALYDKTLTDFDKKKENLSSHFIQINKSNNLFG
jgi:hypothetical protein